MRPARVELYTWFRCPCGFEAGGDRISVEGIHVEHQTACIATRQTMELQLQAAVFEP